MCAIIDVCILFLRAFYARRNLFWFILEIPLTRSRKYGILTKPSGDGGKAVREARKRQKEATESSLNTKRKKDRNEKR